MKIAKWAKKNLFLIIVVFIYSIFSFIHLGDFKAPQSFHIFDEGEELYIALPKEQKVSKVLLYVGPSYGDMSISYTNALASGDTKCKCNSVEKIIGDKSRFGEYIGYTLDGGFKWKEIPINRYTSVIKIRADYNYYKSVWIGEVAVVGLNNDFIEDIKVGLSPEGILEGKNELPELMDERDVVSIKGYDSMNSTYFDEIYFAETAMEYSFGIRGYENVHPPLGKILQSIPISIFKKMTPFTWRCMGAFTGILIVISMYYLALELFHESKEKEKFAKITLLLSAMSTLILTQSRLGTVDSYLCLFIILSFLFMIKFVNNPKKLLWLGLSGLFFGCALSVKWTGAFIGIGLAIIYLSKNRFKNIWKWLGFGALFFVVVPTIIYFGCYLLFPKTTEAHNVGDVISQGQNLYSYHSTENRPHPAQSMWYTWPISLVPFHYYYDGDGTGITLVGNYATNYISIVALLITLYFMIRKKDKISLYIIVAFLSMFLPFALISRPMFLYHYIPASCFAIVAITNMIRLLAPKSKVIPAIVIGAAAVSFIILFRTATGL